MSVTDIAQGLCPRDYFSTRFGQYISYKRIVYVLLFIINCTLLFQATKGDKPMNAVDIYTDDMTAEEAFSKFV